MCHCKGKMGKHFVASVPNTQGAPACATPVTPPHARHRKPCTRRPQASLSSLSTAPPRRSLPAPLSEPRPRPRCRPTSRSPFRCTPLRARRRRAKAHPALTLDSAVKSMTGRTAFAENHHMPRHLRAAASTSTQQRAMSRQVRAWPLTTPTVCVGTFSRGAHTHCVPTLSSAPPNVSAPLAGVPEGSGRYPFPYDAPIEGAYPGCSMTTCDTDRCVGPPAATFRTVTAPCRPARKAPSHT